MTNEFADRVREAATPDVVRTIAWLDASGFARSGGRGGQVVRWESEDIGVVISWDRSQWMLDFVMPTGTKHDLDIIIDVRHGITEWHNWEGPLPRQLPEGAVWAEEVPASLLWLRKTPDVDHLLKAAKRERASQLF